MGSGMPDGANHDVLPGAGKPVMVLLIISLLLAGAMAADIHFRSQNQDRSAWQWMRALELTAPTLFFAGHPQRHPQNAHDAVDSRMSAFTILP